MILDALLALALAAPADPVTPDREAAATRPSRSAPALRSAAAVPRGWGAFAACVEQRESGGSPTAVNSSSGAAGLFQLLPAWRHGAPYIVRERLRQFGYTAAQARTVRVYLTGLHYIERWPAMYQRVLFAEVIEDGLWTHWTLPGSRCEGLRP